MSESFKFIIIKKYKKTRITMYNFEIFQAKEVLEVVPYCPGLDFF
jgi:hypothetical protein